MEIALLLSHRSFSVPLRLAAWFEISRSFRGTDKLVFLKIRLQLINYLCSFYLCSVASFRQVCIQLKRQLSFSDYITARLKFLDSIRSFDMEYFVPNMDLILLFFFFFYFVPKAIINSSSWIRSSERPLIAKCPLIR